MVGRPFEVLKSHFEPVEGSSRERALWSGQYDASWLQGRAIFGGLLGATLGRAFEVLVDDPRRRPRSMSMQLAGPVVPGPVTVEASVLRTGKSVTHLSGRIVQEDQPAVVALAAFGSDRDHPLVYSEETSPSALSPEEAEPAPFIPGVMPEFARHVEFRFCLGHPPFSGAAEPAMGGWCRLREPAPPDLVAVAAMLDAWPPPSLAMMRAPAPAATIDLTYHFLSPLPVPGMAADEPFLFTYRSPTIAHGYAEQLGTLWTPRGTLVGRVRQMVAVF